MINYGQKYCRKCGTYKDRACFAEYRIGGEPHCWCITCTRDYNAQHGTRSHSAYYGAKRCTKCKKNRPVSMFYKDKRKKDGYCSECKQCHNTLKG